MDQAAGNIFAFPLEVFIFGFISGARRAKPSFVVPFVKRVVSFRRLCFCHAAPQLAYTLVMEGLSRPHKEVKPAMLSIQTELGRHLLVIVNDVVRLLLRRPPG